MATVADHVIATLRTSGIRRVYGLPGDSLNGFTDALRRAGDISWEHVRHEETAAFAAAADAALTGQLAVCAGSCGPGNLHLINGLFDAQRSRVPVLAIAAHIPRAEIGSEYFQETHPQQLFGECSVYREMVSTAEMLPRILHMAMRAAVEERGVAVIVVPGEIFLQKTDATPWQSRPVVATRSVLRPDDAALRDAASILNAAQAVTILGGAGVEGAHDELVRLAATLNAPVVHALRGKEFIEYDNPYDVGMTGLLGFASGYKAIKEADTLLMLGTDFPISSSIPITPRSSRSTSAAGTSAGAHRSTSAWSAPWPTPRPRCNHCCGRRPTERISTARCVTTAKPARPSTTLPSTIATAPRSGRNTLPDWLIGSPPRMRCSPPTSALRWCGPPATWR